MKAFARSVTATLVAILLTTGWAGAQGDGMAYRWRAPGAFFGDPTPISDRDESSQSGSSFRVAYRAEPESDVRSRDILVGTYTVAPNRALGYQYAGFAVPFNTPMGLVTEGDLRVDVRAERGVGRLEIVMRDSSRQRATHEVSVAPSTEWSTITVPASQLASIDGESIQSVAFVVLSPGSGTIEFSNVHLPLRSLATELTILEEIRTAPKWYPDADMAVRVAKRLNRPVLVRVMPSPETPGADMPGASWRRVMEQTVNIPLTVESLETLPKGFVVGSSTSTDQAIMLFETDGTLLMTTGVSDADAEAIATLLAKRAKDQGQ